MKASPNQPILEIYLLGAPELRLNGKPLINLPAKTQALLFYLVMTRQPQLRTSLAALLWADLPEKMRAPIYARQFSN